MDDTIAMIEKFIDLFQKLVEVIMQFFGGLNKSDAPVEDETAGE